MQNEKQKVEYDVLEVNYHIEGKDENNNLPHNDSSIELVQMWSNGGFFVMKKNIFPIETGVVFLVNAIETHYSNPENIEEYKRSKIIITYDYFSTLMRILGVGQFEDKYLREQGGYMFRLNPSSATIMEIDGHFEAAKRYYDILHENDLAKAQLTLEIMQILVLLLTEDTKQAHIRKNENMEDSPTSVALLCDYVNRNINSYENITLEKICKELHLSPSYVSHLFKRITNVSIIQYATAIRMAEAKKLLLNTDMKVVEIAEKLHFQNSTVFCKTFKKVVHCTPLEYRLSKGKHRS